MSNYYGAAQSLGIVVSTPVEYNTKKISLSARVELKQQHASLSCNRNPKCNNKVNMHIKQITLSNFRSFRQQPEIHPFSAGTNVVVGRNGSGKVNK